MGLALTAFFDGCVPSLVLLGARSARRPAAMQAASVFVQAFHGAQLLMQLFLANFGLALFGIDTANRMTASVALTLYTTAFLVEIWRGCVALQCFA